MKKHELLKFAYDNYPKGTKYICGSKSKEIIESSGVFRISQNESQGTWVTDDLTSYVICSTSGKWVEIVKSKIAVKVENEKEFKALMKYYDSLGYVWNGGDKASDKKGLQEYPNNIEFENKAQHTIPKNSPDHKIITFSDFAKEHGIKVSILKSEDGLDLYDKDPIFIAVNRNEKWMLDWHADESDDNEQFELTDNGKFISTEKEKYFSTKESALKWIEEQNPKETVLEYGAYKFTIKKDSVNVSHGDSDTDIDIEAIYNAWQELS